MHCRVLVQFDYSLYNLEGKKNFNENFFKSKNYMYKNTHFIIFFLKCDTFYTTG